MRVAVISDIHGNLVALKAALLDIRSRKIDHVICLGDVAATGPQPTEAIELLQRISCPCVMGNTDEALVANSPREIRVRLKAVTREEERRNLEALYLWTRKRLTTTHKQYLSTLKRMIKINLRLGETLLCYHGSPVSNNDMILPETSNEKLMDMFEGRKERVFAGGHTHKQMLRPFLSSLVVNPGSIGLAQRELSTRRVHHCAVAEYALVSSSGETMSVEFVTTPYSLPDLRQAVRKSGMPDPEWWLSDWC